VYGRFPMDFELVVGSAGQQISTGSALPEFDGIKINLSEDKTKGQRVIVCFFDYQQRPSRNCIIQLSKRSEQLKGKGVAVVAVQVSKIDENKLDEWIKEQNISFPVGMIQDNQEQISNIWGVKSLPWLILTDSEHVVGSQGFSIVELDEKLKNDTQ
jgi:peroxiredoxin